MPIAIITASGMHLVQANTVITSVADEKLMDHLVSNALQKRAYRQVPIVADKFLGGQNHHLRPGSADHDVGTVYVKQKIFVLINVSRIRRTEAKDNHVNSLSLDSLHSIHHRHILGSHVRITEQAADQSHLASERCHDRNPVCFLCVGGYPEYLHCLQDNIPRKFSFLLIAVLSVIPMGDYNLSIGKYYFVEDTQNVRINMS